MRLASGGLAADLFLDLIGKPYVEKARGPAAYDCVGLALEMCRRLGKILPDYVSSEAELHRQLAAGNEALADLPQIAAAVPGCLVLLRLNPGQHHLGVMVDPYRMIHTTAATGCVIERIHTPLWQRKIIGFYGLEASS